MGEYLEETVGDASLATFLGFWSVMGGYLLRSTTSYHSFNNISECPVCLYWHRTRGIYFLRNLDVVLIFIQIGVTVGEAENPRRNVPKGPHAMIFPWVPTHRGSQPYGGVCQVAHTRDQAIDTSFFPAFFRISVFYVGYLFLDKSSQESSVADCALVAFL